MGMLKEYNPRTYTEETLFREQNSLSNLHQSTPKKREEALVQFWNMLNYLRKDYYSFLREWQPNKLEEPLIKNELYEHEVSETIKRQS
jgi:hypothetical protein